MLAGACFSAFARVCAKTACSRGRRGVLRRARLGSTHCCRSLNAPRCRAFTPARRRTWPWARRSAGRPAFLSRASGGFAPTTFRTLPLCTCCRDNSGTATGSTASLMRPVMSALPDRVFWSPVHRPFRGLLGVDSVTARTLAVPPIHGKLHQRLQQLRCFHYCSVCSPGERSLAGPPTHWETPS